MVKRLGRTDRRKAGVMATVLAFLAYSVAKSCKRDGAFPILASSKADQLPVDDQGPPFFDPRDARAVRYLKFGFLVSEQAGKHCLKRSLVQAAQRPLERNNNQPQTDQDPDYPRDAHCGTLQDNLHVPGKCTAKFSLFQRHIGAFGIDLPKATMLVKVTTLVGFTQKLLPKRIRYGAHLLIGDMVTTIRDSGTLRAVASVLLLHGPTKYGNLLLGYRSQVQREECAESSQAAPYSMHLSTATDCEPGDISLALFARVLRPSPRVDCEPTRPFTQLNEELSHCAPTTLLRARTRTRSS
ncbi:hypothetical protein EDB84DRAFT_1439544 [Lactarius hengduanensis]|nr:hypothetical protein EDB84DRAFT_1439544 [Lactarius hengduanensis]